MISRNALKSYRPSYSLPNVCIQWRCVWHHRTTWTTAPSASRSIATGHGHRDCLSSFWVPAQRQSPHDGLGSTGHDLLIRAGFLRQAHTGIFHLLPLGLRVQNKIELLLDRHMQSLGASKVSLSSLSSEELWQQSGRLAKGRGSEFLRLEDRKGARYLLAPTHEEEITSIVADAVHSYRDLPLRLYQVSKKYRDEIRPRQGLLRGREFIMKDLYTFDVSDEAAKNTYDQVRNVYGAFFDELNLPYLVAAADSGDMGGDLSHEYHFASPEGEDTVISCQNCGYAVNEEKFIASAEKSVSRPTVRTTSAIFLSKDGEKAVCFSWPGSMEDLNHHLLKATFPELNNMIHSTDSKELGSDQARRLRNVKSGVIFRDPRIDHEEPALTKGSVWGRIFDAATVTTFSINGEATLLTKAADHDPCPRCHIGELQLHRAVEIGHTFHLGTRYSVPFQAEVLTHKNEHTHISMGCHGIGVSRLIGATASLLADDKGLNWPVAIAPFGCAIMSTPDIAEGDVNAVYDTLSEPGLVHGLDVVIEDRQKPMGWKLNDADLVGYPFIIVLGKYWKQDRKELELQCRQLGLKERIPAEDIGPTMRRYAEQLSVGEPSLNNRLLHIPQT